MENKDTNFFDMDRIPVRLSYLFTDPATVITFYCKMALSADDETARQAFYAKPEGEQAAGLHSYYVDLLSRITAARPEGLPGFDATSDPADGLAETRDKLKSFLSDPSEMKTKVVADAIQRYNQIVQPAEFFR